MCGRKPFLVAVVFCVAGTLGCPLAVRPTGTVEEYEQAAFDAINEIRVEHDLEPLVLDEALRAVARAHSQDMADRNYFGHFSPDGFYHADRLSDAGISFSASGENLAYVSGVANPVPPVVKGWKNSPGHQTTILDADGEIQWTHSGMGVALEGPKAYFTQLFCRYTLKEGQRVTEVVLGETLTADIYELD